MENQEPIGRNPRSSAFISGQLGFFGSLIALVRLPPWSHECAKLSYMHMSESLRPTWNALYHEVVAVHARWIIYRQLFAVSEERINTLNASASTFFCVIQATLLDDVQLTLSKLADPAMTKGRPNATLERLVNEIEKLNDQPFHDKLKDLLNEYRASCGRIK